MGQGECPVRVPGREAARTSGARTRSVSAERGPCKRPVLDAKGWRACTPVALAVTTHKGRGQGEGAGTVILAEGAHGAVTVHQPGSAQGHQPYTHLPFTSLETFQTRTVVHIMKTMYRPPALLNLKSHCLLNTRVHTNINMLLEK